MFLQKVTVFWLLAIFFLLSCSHSPAPAKKNLPSVKSSAPLIAPTQTSSQAISIQELEESESYSGAGTGFQLASAPSDSNKVIFGYADPAEPSNMRINNQLVVLRHVNSKVLKAGKGRQGLGERVKDTWANESITVEFDYTTTVVGEGGVGYKGKVTIQINSQKATYPITGGSGC
jgi:hypothetical protein